MSKGLEAIKRLRQNNIDDTHLFDDELLDIIEKELSSLNYLMREVIHTFEKEDFTLEQLGNKLKAIKIIKEKNIDLALIKICVSAYAYNDFKELTETHLVKRKEITQEELDIIRRAVL